MRLRIWCSSKFHHAWWFLTKLESISRRWLGGPDWPYSGFYSEFMRGGKKYKFFSTVAIF